MEMQLRRTIQDEGELKHAKDSGNSKSEESPVVELKLGDGTRRYSGQEARTIDLGKGPEDVIFIDWAEGDPEVSSPTSNNIVILKMLMIHRTPSIILYYESQSSCVQRV
jgi:hypothetical protein